jgi:protein XagA
MKKIIFFSLLCLFFDFDQAAATGWPQPKGHGFYKLDFYSIRARRFFSDDRQVYDINGAGTLFGAYTTSLYAEYGLTNRLTAVAYVPFFVRNTVNEGVGAITGEVLQPGLEHNNIGDIDLSLKYLLWKKNRFVLSSTLMLGLPTGNSNQPNLLYTGDGEFNQFLRLDWGYGANRWYATGYVGLNNRTNNFSEELRYFGELGFWFLPEKLMGSLKLSAVHSFNNGSPENTGNGLFSNNVEFVSPQAGLTYQFNKKCGISVLAGGAVMGRNVLAAPAFSVGVFAKI